MSQFNFFLPNIFSWSFWHRLFRYTEIITSCYFYKYADFQSNNGPFALDHMNSCAFSNSTGNARKSRSIASYQFCYSTLFALQLLELAWFLVSQSTTIEINRNQINQLKCSFLTLPMTSWNALRFKSDFTGPGRTVCTWMLCSANSSRTVSK